MIWYDTCLQNYAVNFLPARKHDKKYFCQPAETAYRSSLQTASAARSACMVFAPEGGWNFQKVQNLLKKIIFNMKYPSGVFFEG
jgi:hypothetical protein